MEIIQYPNRILRTPTKKVTKFDKKLKLIIEKMKKIMVKKNGVGIAANQIGYPFSIFLAKPKNKFYIFINPELEKGKNEVIKEEGCLSIQNRWGLVKRFEEVKVKFQDLRGKIKTLKAKGLLAQIIQHEIDHLNGILFIDKAIEVYEIKNNEKEA